jgi:hypothetical protein
VDFQVGCNLFRCGTSSGVLGESLVLNSKHRLVPDSQIAIDLLSAMNWELSPADLEAVVLTCSPLEQRLAINLLFFGCLHNRADP